MIIVDTGPIFAAANRRDRDHAACAQLIGATSSLLIPAAVMAEACYLIGSHLGPKVEAAFLRSLTTERFTLVEPTDDDLERAAELVVAYADLPLGGVDAMVIAAGERLGADTIATLDRRHFSVVQPRHRRAFSIVP